MNAFLTIPPVLGCWLLACTMAQARIGETEKECEARYGKPAEAAKGEAMQLYIKGEMGVLAHFYEGTCDYIMFRKMEKTGPQVAKPMSENERNLLLKANGGERKWQKISREEATDIYETEDGALRAQHDTSDNTLTIFSDGAVKRSLDQEKAEEAKKLKGF